MTDQQHRENDIDLCEAVGRLPDRLRCVVLLYSYGYGQREIAEDTGVTQQCVSKRLEKAFNLLKLVL